MKPRLVLLLGVCIFLLAVPVGAHPLGNFTTNQYLGLHLTEDGISVDHVVDFAEIPTSQLLSEVDGNGDGEVDDTEAQRYGTSACRSHTDGISLVVSGKRQPLVASGSSVSTPPGEGGALTLRLECRYRAAPHPSRGMVDFNFNTFTDRLGWREVVVTSSGVDVTSDLPNSSVTNRLRSYPQDRLRSPVEVGSGTVAYVVDPDASRGLPPPPPGEPSSGADGATGIMGWLGGLVDLRSGGTLPLAVVGALALGIVHALAPGHGKTVMAAYLIGSRGSARHAVALGLAVAVSHTLGVLVLGVLTWVGASTFAPEQVIPVLSVISGVIIVAVGVWMLWSWLRSRRRSDDETGHHHHEESTVSEGAVEEYGHVHGFGYHTHVLPDQLRDAPGWKVLATMGLAGGLVPSASAVIILLASISLGRIPTGLLLIVLFGLGMAATLVSVGFLLLFASRLGIRILGRSGPVARMRELLIPAAGAVVIIVGVGLTVAALPG